jgi:hypothetical protein
MQSEVNREFIPGSKIIIGPFVALSLGSIVAVDFFWATTDQEQSSVHVGFPLKDLISSWLHKLTITKKKLV